MLFQPPLRWLRFVSTINSLIMTHYIKAILIAGTAVFFSIQLKAQQGVGIGPASVNPQEMLQVDGAIKLGTDFINTSAAPTGGAGTIHWNGTNFQGWDGTQWTTFGGGADADWTISGNDIYSANSGNVGIGTSNPLTKLHLTSTSGDAVFSLTPGAGGSGRISFRRSNNNISWTLGETPTNDFFLFDYQNNATPFRVDAGAGNAALRVASSGNVGVGTGGPTQKLHVEGSIRMVDGNEAVGFIPVSDVNGKMTWTDPFGVVTSQAWGLTGNSGTDPSINFIGTSDAQALKFKVNNEKAGYIDHGTPYTTSLGYQALNVNTGTDNVAIGYQALLANTSGVKNTAVGKGTLSINTTGSYNTAMGYAMLNNTVGDNNTAIGDGALVANTIADNNTAVGGNAMFSNTTGENNTALGVESLANNTTGSKNTAVGLGALNANTTASFNTAIGWEAMYATTTGNNSTAAGHWALHDNTTGVGNVAFGSHALRNNIVGDSNTAMGVNAGQSNTGSNNVFLGNSSGSTNTGSGNVFLGFQAGQNEVGSDKLYIDNSNIATPLIYGDFGTDLLRVNGTLNVNNAYSFPIADGANGFVLTTNGSGTTAWIDPTGISGPIDEIADADNDTKIQVEENPDEDRIRFDLAGTEKWVMRGSRLEPANTGNGLFIGANAGQSDDLNNRNNHFIGNLSGALTTTGENNTAFGNATLTYNTTGEANVAVGDYSGHQNSSGIYNTYLGAQAGSNQQTGNQNTLVGYYAGRGSALYSGSSNTMVGYLAGSNVAGNGNVFLGNQAGENETGSNRLYIDNTNTGNPLIFGDFSTDWLKINGRITPTGGVTDVDNDTKIQVEETADEDIIRFDMAGTEYFTMSNGKIGVLNTNSSVYIGQSAGGAADYSPASEKNNVGIGSIALSSVTDGGWNTAIGYGALNAVTSGVNNIGIGPYAMGDNSTGSHNTAVGAGAGDNHNSGDENVFLGRSAGADGLGSGNVLIGTYSGQGQSLNNRLFIENTNTSSPLIYGEFDNDLLRINGTLNVNNAYSFPTVDGTSGYVMTTDGSGAVTWTNPGTITTADDGDWVVAGNDIYNANTGNLGIGTSTPDRQLNIESATGPQMLFTRNDNNTVDGELMGEILFDNNDDTAPSSVDAAVVIRANASGPQGNSNKGGYLSILTKNSVSGTLAATERMRVAADGKVGIGTSSPAAILHVAGSGTTDAEGIRISGSNGNAVIYMNGSGDLVMRKVNLTDQLVLDVGGNIGIGTSGPAQKLDVQGSIRMVDGNQAAGYLLVSDATGKMTWTNPATIITPDNDWTVSGNDVYSTGSGNVGIGQSSPSQKLHVGGNLLLDRNGIINNTTRTITVGGSRQDAGNDFAQINFQNYDPNSGAVDYTGARIAVENDGGADDGALSFHTTDSGTLSKQMTITSGGNVGIGQVSPASKLVVQTSADGFEVFAARIINTANSNSSRDEGLLVRAGHNTFASGQESSMVQFETPNATYLGRIRQSGSNSVDYVTTSDIRLKTDIVETQYGLDDLLAIEVKDYHYKADGRKLETGFIAQQLFEHYPTAVDVGGENVEERPWGVAYGKLTPLLVKSMQDLKNEKDQLQEQVQSQQAVIEQLLQRVSQLEQH
ncbi:MAG: hypothetical protein GC178_06200 [Flavobacteriales bacterium]|nr:hypothetical protein [Flavobacteriales bacterium]